jgi:hypothetical protein
MIGRADFSVNETRHFEASNKKLIDEKKQRNSIGHH